MASLTSIKNVAAGIEEYIGCATLSMNEFISFEFNQSVVIDDISIKKSGGLPTKIEIVYPSIAQTALIKSGIDGAWFLNDGTNGAGKRWYHLPARSKLVLTLTGEGTETMTLLVLGRAG
jgi:hypothetical protein